MHKTITSLYEIVCTTLLLFFNVNPALAQTTAFTYQGKLTDAGLPASGNYDLQFKLFDTATVGTGTQQGSTLTNSSVAVTAGIFTVQLDFGAAAFNGLPRFLEIGVRPAGSPDPYTLLAPRQPVTSTPYAVRSLNSSVADTLSSACVGCVTSTQVGSVDGGVVTGTIPVASVPAGSASYVQNTTNPQAAANFNISGTGTANIFSAATQYNIAGSRAFTVSDFSSNVFGGIRAGAANGVGGGNSFFGHAAGETTSTGSNNSFFGKLAGSANTGSSNSFFGSEAGFGNTTGTRNSYVGLGAGKNNLTGSDNAFFGYHAGFNNTASFNSFFGNGAGDSNTIGIYNSFFGYNAGQANTNGDQNAFFGRLSGQSNTSGDQNSFFGSLSGGANTTGCCNSFFGWSAGSLNSTGTSNVFIGDQAGANNTSGGPNTAIGTLADVGFANLNFATAIGSHAIVAASNQVQLGRNGSDTVSIGALTTASSIHVCINGTVLSSCSSSRRYKENIHPFGRGLELLRRLRPVTFDWIERREADLGLIAEEVGGVEPLLVTHNRNGEIEGVKYDQLTTVLINAVNEQQQIIEQQQRQIDVLRRLVCELKPAAKICKKK